MPRLSITQAWNETAEFARRDFGPLFAVATRFFGRSVAGLSSGFGNFCANLGGFASALALGVLKDVTGSFSAGFFFLAGVAFLGCTGVTLLLDIRATLAARDARLRLVANGHVVLRPLSLLGLLDKLPVSPDVWTAMG